MREPLRATSELGTGLGPQRADLGAACSHCKKTGEHNPPAPKLESPLRNCQGTLPSLPWTGPFACSLRVLFPARPAMTEAPGGPGFGAEARGTRLSL